MSRSPRSRRPGRALGDSAALAAPALVGCSAEPVASVSAPSPSIDADTLTALAPVTSRGTTLTRSDAVLFDFDSAEISPDAGRQLNRRVEILVPTFGG